MRQDVYGVAYQEAKSELLDITCKFEQLRQRKNRLEGVVAALSPMMGAKVPMPAFAEASPVLMAETAPAEETAPVETSTYSFDAIDESPAAGEEDVNDPFERRIRNALKFGSPHREGLQQAV